MDRRTQWSKLDHSKSFDALIGDYLHFSDLSEVCSVGTSNVYCPICFYSKACDYCDYVKRHDGHALLDYKCTKR